MVPSKNFLGPPKTQKIDFLKKPDLCDLTEHWRWFPQWPWSPGYHQTPVFNSKINYLAVAQCEQLMEQLALRILKQCCVAGVPIIAQSNVWNTYPYM